MQVDDYENDDFSLNFLKKKIKNLFWTPNKRFLSFEKNNFIIFIEMHNLSTYICKYVVLRKFKQQKTKSTHFYGLNVTIRWSQR